MLEKAKRVRGGVSSLRDGGSQVLLETGTFEGFQVRSSEVRHGPWMEATNRRIEAENAKARRVLFEKRVFDLAKQAAHSLQGLGIRCEMTTIANILRTACKHRALSNEQQDANPPAKNKEEVEHACRVLDACLQFDAQRLAILLGFSIKVDKTFGEGVVL